MRFCRCNWRLLTTGIQVRQKGNYPGGPILITWEFKNRLFSGLQQNWKAERFEGQEGLGMLLLAWGWMGPCEKECGRPWGAEREALGWQPPRKQGPQTYSCREWNSANNLNEPGSEFFPDENPAWLAPWFWPWETLSKEPGQPHLDFWPVNS